MKLDLSLLSRFPDTNIIATFFIIFLRLTHIEMLLPFNAFFKKRTLHFQCSHSQSPIKVDQFILKSDCVVPRHFYSRSGLLDFLDIFTTFQTFLLSYSFGCLSLKRCVSSQINSFNFSLGRSSNSIANVNGSSATG